jgi:hypothetical protein
MERGLGDVGDPQAGVRFRVIVYDDGTTERWRQPRLVLFELLGCDPAEPRSQPRVATRAARRTAARREHQRGRDAAQRAARHDGAQRRTRQAISRVIPRREPVVLRAFGLSNLVDAFSTGSAESSSVPEINQHHLFSFGTHSEKPVSVQLLLGQPS